MNPLPGDLFARRLRQERERLGVTQGALARQMADLLGSNVDSTAITRIEQQTRAVRLDEAVCAAQALGVPLIALLTDDAARENEEAIQHHLVELALAEQDWEKQRHEIDRITRVIRELSAERKQLRLRTASMAASDVDFDLDQAMKNAIDARAPKDRQPWTDPNGEVTNPDA
ncbi:MAG: XRE family transcriptional regulator [Gordonia sp. (in: high G+C Gram-positive bacteria)]|nr:MAG: XRE family transcriptional regulator [Gordonia sp. (in: high G+C Gram-positive bacteria)]